MDQPRDFYILGRKPVVLLKFNSARVEQPRQTTPVPSRWCKSLPF